MISVDLLWIFAIWNTMFRNISNQIMFPMDKQNATRS